MWYANVHMAFVQQLAVTAVLPFVKIMIVGDKPR